MLHEQKQRVELSRINCQDSLKPEFLGHLIKDTVGTPNKGRSIFDEIGPNKGIFAITLCHT